MRTEDITLGIAACLHIGKLSAGEEIVILVGGRHGDGPRLTTRSIHQINRAIGGIAGARNVLGPGGQGNVGGEGITRQNGRASGPRAAFHADSGIGRHLGVLEVGLNHPWARAIGIDQVVDVAVVLINRGGECGITRLSRIAHAHETHGVGGVNGVGQVAGKPVEAIGVETVTPCERGAQWPRAVVDLHPAIDGVFLVPQQAALDVHILESEGVFRADQGGEFADQHREVFGGSDLQIGLWQGTILVGGGGSRGKERRAQGRHIVGTGLEEELDQPVCLLDEDLAIADIGVGEPITGDSVVLPDAHAAHHAGNVQFS